ncbi:MAG: tyrosine-type recombinase/integrase [bacterium]|nr:tyrosine-type recombinase/integrase [bacterium]
MTRARALTQRRIETLKATGKPYKVTDGGGLYLYVTAAGVKSWRMDFRFNGKRQTVCFGVFPVVPLALAREKALVAHRQIADGINPMEAKKNDKLLALQREQETRNTVEAVAQAWIAHRQEQWSASTVAAKRRLLAKILPKIGGISLKNLEPQQILAVARTEENAGHTVTAHQIVQVIAQIIEHGRIAGLCQYNPAFGLTRALKRVETKHHAALGDKNDIASMLLALEKYDGETSTRNILRVLPYLFVRPHELTEARWNEFDLDAALWKIPAERMKRRKEHLVPLPRQIVALLREMLAYRWSAEWVFPAASGSGPISPRTVRRAIEGTKYAGTMTPHGFRAIARSFLHEQLHFQPDVIEIQLSHRVPDRLGDTYARASHLEERVHMMQAWADFLDELKAAAKEAAE